MSGRQRYRNDNMRKPDGEKLPILTKIGFGMGDLYGGGSMMVVGTLYLIFLTDIVKIAPGRAGLVVMLSKIWDAVSDPLMGSLSDRTRTRFGRRRPYFLAGIFLIFLSFVLLWYPVGFESGSLRFLYVLVTYLFFSTVITMVMIPYNALASELTLDYNERSSLASVRILFSTASTLICAVLPLEIIKLFGDSGTGYAVMGAAFGLFFALPFLGTFFTTRERKEFQPTASPFDLRGFIRPFRIRSFRNVLGMYLFLFLTIDVIMTVIIYFMTYYIGRKDETNYVLGVLLVSQLAVIPLFSRISRKKGKKTGYLTGLGIMMAMMAISFLVTPQLHPAAIYVFAVLVGAGMGGAILMIYAIFPDIPDVDELVTGERREGVYSGMFTFLRKLSAALAIFLIGQAIEFAGYVPPVDSVPQPQSGTFLLLMRILFAVVPFFLLTFAMLSALRYPLTPALHRELRSFLASRRASRASDEEEQRKLKHLLAGDGGERRNISA